LLPDGSGNSQDCCKRGTPSARARRGGRRGDQNESPAPRLDFGKHLFTTPLRARFTVTA